MAWLTVEALKILKTKMLTFKNKHFKIVYFVKESSMSNTW